MNFRHLIAIASLSLLAACALPGNDAFTDYRKSYDLARDASTGVIQVYNQYDKANRKRRTNRFSFDPDLADVYSPDALTPISARATDGFAAATIYNEVLARYADNSTLSLQDDDLKTLNGVASTAATFLGTADVGPKLGAVVKAAVSLSNLSLARSDREEFERNVRENSDTVRAFLVLVRSDTRSMYADAFKATQDSNGSVEKLAKFKKMLALWVLLIDQTLSDLSILEARVLEGPSGQTGLSLLADSAVRLQNYARDINAAREDILGVF